MAENTLQEARAQASENVFASWLDDVARRTPEDPAADTSSEDATQVNAPDHEDEVQATTPITASRIILSTAATMTTWNGEHETDKCGEGEIKSIMMGESVVGVPTTFVSGNDGYVVVHRGIDFPSSGSAAASNVTRADGTFQHKDHATNQTDVVRWRDDGKTQLVQRNEMKPAGIRMEVTQQTC